MDTKLQSFLDKVKDTASRTGRSVGRAADAAGKKASEMAAATRLNLRIFDLNTECDVLFRDIGRMVYELHRGDDERGHGREARGSGREEGAACRAARPARFHAFGQHLPELRQDLQPRGLLLSRLRHGAIIV